MSVSKSSWDDTPIRSAAELRAFIIKLKESVASGTMQQYWPADAPFATETKITDINETASWPTDYLEWYFLLTTSKKRYRLSAETYHGVGGNWKRLDY